MTTKKIHLTLDPLFLGIILVSFLTRFYKFGYPSSVVFDELHYIKFITLYAKRIFFFDPQPPLGKQLITFFAYVFGFEGDLSYSQIGEEYKPEVPVQALRLLPCICGSLLAPFCYLVAMELGMRQTSAAIVAILIIFENSLLTQSRFILLDPILIIFSISSIYFYLKFSKSGSTTCLYMSALSVTLAACTKYSGFYSCGLLIGLVCYSWWSDLDRLQHDKLFNSIARLSSAFLAPIVIYLLIYYGHLAWLTKAGPHDSIMTSAFQASLENGLASIIRGQPLEIVHGSQITLRNTHGKSCWLHSHEHLYPVKYPDGRGSSHQQQVTCYSFKDVNNWWIVKRPQSEKLVVNEPYDKIKDGDIIQLVHGMSGRALNSHDVASPMTPYSQEVSCYVDHNISMPTQNLWQVRLVNPKATEGYWHTINSRIQLVHLNSSLTLRHSGRQLPEWGFNQFEIVADKNSNSDDAIWNVEEHRYTKSEDQKERELEFGQAEFVPIEPTSLSFLDKFYELHYKLLNYQQDAIKDHLYSCDSPLDWIFMTKGTAYWVDTSSQTGAQIFLIGNVTTSLVGIISSGVFVLLLIFYILRRRRKIFTDIDEVTWRKLESQAVVLVCGYLAHVVPYFLYESPLFLQYYLTAFVYKILLIGATLDHLQDVCSSKYVVHSISIFIVAKAMDTFIKLSPLSYGLDLSKDEVDSLRWKETWQLINVNT